MAMLNEYLIRTREDTITCIMASLIDDSNNELAEVRNDHMIIT